MKSIRSLTRIPALMLFVAAAACGGGQKTGTTTAESGGGGQPADQVAQGGGGGQAQSALPAIPAQPAPMPAALLATVSVGQPQAQLNQVAAYVDAINPGFGAMMSPAQMTRFLGMAVGVPDLAGVDLSKPLYLLVLDPMKGGGQALLVVGVSDEKQLAGSVGGGSMVQMAGGFAAIGNGAALNAASPYALSNLIKKAPPAEPHAVVYMARIMDSYGAQLEAQMQQSMGPSKSAPEVMVAKGMVKALKSIDRIEGSLEASAKDATATVEFFPIKGTDLASWSAMQKPADYTVASRLPAGKWLMVAADSIDWSPLSKFLGQLAASQGKPEIGQWFGAVGREMAFALYAKQDQAFRMAAVVQAGNAVQLGKLLSAYVKKMASKTTQMDSMQVTAKVRAYSTGGAHLSGITVKPGPKADATEKKEFEKQFGKAGLKSYFGMAGNWLVFSLDKSKSAKKLAASVVRSAKAKSPKSGLSKEMMAALEASKAKKESGVMVFDLSAIAPDPSMAKGATVTLGIGFDGGTVKGRLSVPPATIKLAMMMKNHM